jgi:hypothetical protein
MFIYLSYFWAMKTKAVCVLLADLPKLLQVKALLFGQ